jgi:hypothetical protein
VHDDSGYEQITVSVLQEVLVREGWPDTIGGGQPSMLVIGFLADIL